MIYVLDIRMNIRLKTINFMSEEVVKRVSPIIGASRYIRVTG